MQFGLEQNKDPNQARWINKNAELRTNILLALQLYQKGKEFSCIRN